MARRQSVAIEGGPELARALRRMETGVRVEVLARAVESGAGEVLGEAKRRVPVGRGDLRGTLEKRVEIKETTPAKVVYSVGPNRDGFYGLFLERGTSRGHRARHWLRKSYAGARAAVKVAIAKALRRGIEQQARRVATRVR